MGLLVDGIWHDTWYDTSATGGRFVRKESQFRNWVTVDGSAGPSGEGGFKADDFEGKGVMVEAGDRYEGLWHAGKRNGRGVLTTPGGNRYEGEFKDDAITGQGTLTLSDGRKFEGQLFEGKPHGQGKLTEPSGTYSGFWMNGCFNDGTRRAAFGVDPAGCP